MRLRASLLALCATLAGLLAAAVAAPSVASPVDDGAAGPAADVQQPTVHHESCTAEAKGPSLGSYPLEATGSCRFAVPARPEWAVVRVQREDPDHTVMEVRLTITVCGPKEPCTVHDYETEDLPIELVLERPALSGRDSIVVEVGYEGLGLRGLTGKGETFEVGYQVASR